MNDLIQAFRVTPENLAQRRAFVRLGEDDARRLLPLLPWARRVAPRLAEEFYDHQFSFGPTRVFFTQHARRAGVPVDTLRKALERAQAEYFVQVFSGAEELWGIEYFRRRLQVGQVHDRIDLPCKWYLGSYADYLRLVTLHLPEELPDPDERAAVLSSLFKVFNLDSQAVVDSYMLSVFQSLGVRLEEIDTAGDGDRTEEMAAIKDLISSLIVGISGCAASLSSTSQGVLEISDRLQSMADAVAAATVQMTASMNEIARSSQEGSNASERARALSQEAEGVIGTLERSSLEIDRSTDSIAQIASQTNLLALNATIEAARSGEAGKGFAVVAGEVKQLARQAAEAASEIKVRVESITKQTNSVANSTGQVGQAVDSFNEFSFSIASAVEEQSSVIQEIAQNAQVVTKSASEAKGAAQDISQLSTHLSELVSHFKLEAEAQPIRRAA